jgi:hypothetical protein
MSGQLRSGTLLLRHPNNKGKTAESSVIVEANFPRQISRGGLILGSSDATVRGRKSLQRRGFAAGFFKVWLGCPME